MKPTLFAIATVLPLVTGVIPTAHAVECAAGVVRAGCAGPNGAVVAGPRGAAAAGTNGNAYEIGPSSWCDRHGCAWQHRDQSSAVRLCFRKWPAGLPLTL
jgi:hypothetical protein